MCCSIVYFICSGLYIYINVCPFVFFFLLAIVLSVLLQVTISDYLLGIFKLLLSHNMMIVGNFIIIT